MNPGRFRTTETLLSSNTYGQDSNGLFTYETDAKGFRTYIRYNFYGRPLSETKYKPDTNARDATYTGTGTIIGTRQWTWDPAFPSLLKNATADLDAAQTSHLYAQYTYDQLGRITLVQSGTGPTSFATMQVTAYDDLLNTITVDTYRDDTTFVRTKTTKDGLGRLTEECAWTAPNVSGTARPTTYAYNLAGQLTAKTLSNGEQYSYTYTRAGTVESEVYPMGRGTKSYTYFPNGKLKTVTEVNGDTVSFVYTKAGQERTKTTAATRIPTPDPLIITTSYCQYGIAEVKEQRAGESTPSQVIAYEYGVDGRVVNESRTIPTPVGSRTASIQRTYDLAGNLGSMSVTGFGGYSKAVTYSTPYFGGTGYNNNSNTLSVIDASSNLIARAGLKYWGGLESISYGTSGGTSVFGYDDPYLHLTSVDNPGTLCDGSYTYDMAGNVIVRDGTNYTYDGMDRLYTGAGITYNYDEISNLGSTTGTEPSSYSYASTGSVNSMLLRTITKTSAQAVTDDTKRGWITGIEARYSNLRWDVFGRLEAIVDQSRGQNGTQEDTYRYYADGLRYRKNEVSTADVTTTSLYLYEGNDILLKEMLEGPVWKTAQVNIRLGGKELGRYVKDYVSGTERLEYAWLDNIGSRRAIADTSGTVKTKIDYTVWGVPTVTNYNGYDGSLEVSYTGKERDATGLYYFNARYYDASIGRFITEDPARNGMNWFVYCGNNPLRFTDPTGLRNIEGATINGDEFYSKRTDSIRSSRDLDEQFVEKAKAEAGIPYSTTGGISTSAVDCRGTVLLALREMEFKPKIMNSDSMSKGGGGLVDVLTGPARPEGTPAILNFYDWRPANGTVDHVTIGVGNSKILTATDALGTGNDWIAQKRENGQSVVPGKYGVANIADSTPFSKNNLPVRQGTINWQFLDNSSW